MKQLYGIVVALGLVLTACSGADAPAPPADTPAPPSPGPTLTAPAEPGGPGATPSPAPSPPPPGCLDGTYRVATFRALGSSDSTAATGTGGDLTMTFDDGSFVMASKGKDPATITIGGTTGDLVLDGRLTGTYAQTEGNLVTFKAGLSSGTVTLRDGKGEERPLPVDQLAEVLAPDDSATATCAGDELTLTNQKLTLELVR